MVRLDAASGESLEVGTGQPTRVATHEFAAGHTGGNDVDHMRLAFQYASHIHHLSHSRNLRPRQHLGHLRRLEHGPCPLQARGRWHARRRQHEDSEREAARGLDRPADTIKAKHIGQFVRVPANGRRALRDHRLSIPARAHH